MFGIFVFDLQGQAEGVIQPVSPAEKGAGLWGCLELIRACVDDTGWFSALDFALAKGGFDGSGLGCRGAKNSCFVAEKVGGADRFHFVPGHSSACGYGQVAVHVACETPEGLAYVQAGAGVVSVYQPVGGAGYGYGTRAVIGFLDAEL